MKIGISVKMRPNGFDRFGAEKFNKIKSYGFDCVDYDLCDTEHILYSMNEQAFNCYLTAERELAQKAGIQIHQTHGPWGSPADDYEELDRTNRMEQMKKSIRATQILGCKYWVIHPLMSCGINDIKEDHQAETWNTNVDFFSNLLPYAEKHGVVICLENMPFLEYSLSTPQQILKLVRHCNSEYLKMCFDTGHAALFSKPSVGDFIREAADEIKVLHIHDNRGDDDLHLPPYEGTIDWLDFSTSLKEIGFNNVLSLEVTPDAKLTAEELDQKCITLAHIARKLALQ